MDIWKYLGIVTACLVAGPIILYAIVAVFFGIIFYADNALDMIMDGTEYICYFIGRTYMGFFGIEDSGFIGFIAFVFSLFLGYVFITYFQERDGRKINSCKEENSISLCYKDREEEPRRK